MSIGNITTNLQNSTLPFLSTMMTSQEAAPRFCKSKSIALVDRSVSNNRLIVNCDGTVGIASKTLGEVAGERILRPLIEKTFYILERGSSFADKLLNRIMGIFPGAEATYVFPTTVFYIRLGGEDRYVLGISRNGEAISWVGTDTGKFGFKSNDLQLGSGNNVILSIKGVLVNREEIYLHKEGTSLWVDFRSSPNEGIEIEDYFDSSSAVSQPLKVRKIELSRGQEIDLTQPILLYNKGSDMEGTTRDDIYQYYKGDGHVIIHEPMNRIGNSNNIVRLGPRIKKDNIYITKTRCLKRSPYGIVYGVGIDSYYLCINFKGRPTDQIKIDRVYDDFGNLIPSLQFHQIEFYDGTRVDIGDLEHRGNTGLRNGA